jgi:carbon storage regulator
LFPDAAATRAAWPAPPGPFPAGLSKEESSVLMITRKPGEKIMLGDDVVVHVMEIVGNSVRIGIHAPRSLPVYREEIWEAVRQENEAAARTAADTLPGDAGAPETRPAA